MKIRDLRKRAPGETIRWKEELKLQEVVGSIPQEWKFAFLFISQQKWKTCPGWVGIVLLLRVFRNMLLWTKNDKQESLFSERHEKAASAIFKQD